MSEINHKRQGDFSDKDKGFDYISITQPCLFKFKVDSEKRLVLYKLQVKRETIKGWFVASTTGVCDVYVTKSDEYKRYAQPTVELAKEVFIKSESDKIKQYYEKLTECYKNIELILISHGS
jgi:pyruvate/2-oxoacid:ferredoxin oxidoreductase beta subunit